MNDDASAGEVFTGETPADGVPANGLPLRQLPVGEVVELTIPHEARYIRVARLAVSGIAAQCGFDVDAIDDLRLAVDELCVCCVECARGPITLRFTWVGEALDVCGRSAVGPETASMLDERRFDLTHQIVFAAVGAHRLYIDDEWVHFSFSRSVMSRSA